MGFDQRIQRTQGCRADADLVGERRQAEIDAFTGIALALPVQRLMLPELLEQNHGKDVWTGKTTWRHVEGRRWLRDHLALPAREPLSHRLNHFPLTRDHLECFCHILP